RPSRGVQEGDRRAAAAEDAIRQDLARYDQKDRRWERVPGATHDRRSRESRRDHGDVGDGRVSTALSRRIRLVQPPPTHTRSACHTCRCWCRGRIVKQAKRLYRTCALNGEVTRTWESGRPSAWARQSSCAAWRRSNSWTRSAGSAKLEGRNRA